MDHSGLEAVQALVENYQRSGKSLALVNLSEKCQDMLRDLAPTTEVNCPTENVSSVETAEEAKMIKIFGAGDVNGSSG